MSSDQPGPLIGAGRAADVYALGENALGEQRVLRRYRNGGGAEREAGVMAHLAGAGYPVPRVYDASGPDLVMERLDGRDMLADLSSRPWLVRQYARTLAKLHDRLHAIVAPPSLAQQFGPGDRILHLDLHPGNVLLVHGRDRHGQDCPTVKLSDFGISSELRGMPSIRPNLVHHAVMAPEIIATGYTSKQSDIYQVGLLLFWMLTGESAVPGGVPYPQLMQSVAEGLPRQRAEAIGTPLGSLIAKMLRRREQFRYATAREVWGDLRALPSWKNE